MSQKAENLLNLALDATEEEREKSLELKVGYNPIEREWELIIKYSGALETVRSLASTVTEMANEYAVISIAESRIGELARLPEVDFIEKPKRLFFQTENGKRVSCINEVQRTPFLFGGSMSGDELARLPEVDFIEKPKRLFFQTENGKRVSCINEVQRTPFLFGGSMSGDDLYGNGVLIGIVDSGE